MKFRILFTSFAIAFSTPITQAEDVQLHIDYKDKASMKQLAIDVINQHGYGFIKAECWAGYSGQENLKETVIHNRKLVDYFYAGCSRNMQLQWGTHSADSHGALTSIYIQPNGRFIEIGG